MNVLPVLLERIIWKEEQFVFFLIIEEQKKHFELCIF